VGREIVREQLESNGDVLPWKDANAFLSESLKRGVSNFKFNVDVKGPVVFDRSIIDALSAIEPSGKLSISEIQNYAAKYRYHVITYFTPPWPDIYVSDSERRHSLTDAIEEYQRLKVSYKKYGYQIVELPKLPIAERTDYLLSRIHSNTNL